MLQVVSQFRSPFAAFLRYEPAIKSNDEVVNYVLMMMTFRSSRCLTLKISRTEDQIVAFLISSFFFVYNAFARTALNEEDIERKRFMVKSSLMNSLHVLTQKKEEEEEEAEDQEKKRIKSSVQRET